MSLLTRVAISNGNQLRKAEANMTITAMDSKKVADWNRSLQDTIDQKRHMRAIPLTEGNSFPEQHYQTPTSGVAVHKYNET